MASNGEVVQSTDPTEPTEPAPGDPGMSDDPIAVPPGGGGFARPLTPGDRIILGARGGGRTREPGRWGRWTPAPGFGFGCFL
jgi:hypothetical protein